MLLFQKNLELTRPARLVWDKFMQGPETGLSSPESSETSEPKPDMRLASLDQTSKLESADNLSNQPLNEKSKLLKRKKARARAREAASRENDHNTADQILNQIEGRENQVDLQKMSRAEIRNLERTNPEILLSTCFWKVEEDDKLSPISNSGELKAGDKVRFSVEEANGKNKNLEMGAGLRTLPKEIKVVQIKGEKFYRISEGGPFVDTNGDYRAVHSDENETITLLETTEEDQKTIDSLHEFHQTDYLMNDVANILAELVKDQPVNSPEFQNGLKKTKAENPEMAEFLDVSKNDQARLSLKPGETSKSMRNNNPGNLKFIGQAGAMGPDEDGFARFITLDSGTLAHKNQIRIDARRGFTVLEFTQKYLGMEPGGATTRTAEGDAVKYAQSISDNPNAKLKDLIKDKGIDDIQKKMQEHEGWDGPEFLKT